jgi:uncharacterized protein YukE
MADIVFRYPEMRSAADAIDGLAAKYVNAATTFESEFNAALSGGEGESVEKLKGFAGGSVKEYVGTTVPDLLKALASMLRANADQMEQADRSIAENIPG